MQKMLRCTNHSLRPLGSIRAQKFATTMKSENNKKAFKLNFFTGDISLEYSTNQTVANSEWPRSTAYSQLPVMPEAADERTKYDFELNMTSVEGVHSGWCIQYQKPSSRQYLLEGTAGEYAKILSVLGYYSKGKSFLVNGIYNAAKAKNSGSLERWLDDNNFKQIAGLKEVRTGPGVTTVGISGVFTPAPNNQSAQHANVLILDTAGRNAPAGATSINSDTGSPKSKATNNVDMLKSINQLRSKERLTDDIIMDISNAVIYVVDEVLNEDQRTILHMIDKYCSGDKQLYVVHNFKKLGKDESAAMVEEQIVSAFRAEKSVEQKDVDIWHSYFTAQNGMQTINHLVLYDHNRDAPSRIHNKKVFAFLNTRMFELKRTREFAASPIALIAEAAAKFLASYVTVDLGEAPTPTIGVHNISKCDAQIKLSLDNKHCLRLLEWESREMPKSRNIGQFRPTTSHYPSTKDGKSYYVLRVDLPGIAGKEYYQASREEAKKWQLSGYSEASWFGYEIIESQSTFLRTYSIFGYRKPSTDDRQGDGCGSFNTLFEVSTGYSGTVKASIHCGCFFLTIEKPDQKTEEVLVEDRESW